MDAPVIVVEANDAIDAVPGSEVIFSVVASGLNLLYLWEYGDGSSLNISDPRFKGIMSSRLIISDARFSDEGLYTCVVSNGETVRSTASLTISEYIIVG